LKTVPDAIQKLEGQVASETDARVKGRLEQTLQTRQNQLATLERLQSSMRQAEVQLESTVASLGTIYSQVLTAQSTNQVADYGHLATEVTEQVHQLQDQIEALEEVKLGQPKSNLG
jgi:chromosome segregation ATPase